MKEYIHSEVFDGIGKNLHLWPREGSEKISN